MNTKNEELKELLDTSNTYSRQINPDWLAFAIKYHFEGRSRVWPTVEDGLLWSMTELAEAFELWSAKKNYVRNNPNEKEKYSDERFAEELGDVIYMAMITGLVVGVNPLEEMIKKMRTQIEKEIEE